MSLEEIGEEMRAAASRNIRPEGVPASMEHYRLINVGGRQIEAILSLNVINGERFWQLTLVDLDYERAIEDDLAALLIMAIFPPGRIVEAPIEPVAAMMPPDQRDKIKNMRMFGQKADSKPSEPPAADLTILVVGCLVIVAAVCVLVLLL